MKLKNEKKRPSESFITGVVALVFLIVGYQAAMFAHRAAIMKIEANRDKPDTVYVYESPSQHEDNHKSASVYASGRKTAATTVAKTVVRKNASHSGRVNAVRRNLPVKKVESFSFDPNTVTEEELCRLGFSVRQAQSIINYRKKGGRFRRKSDFAKSYVVSDSIYRRLEPYIDIPLTDLNLADSAALDALPGIGGWYATKIIEHRKALGGFSYKEQLLDVGRMDRDRYEALCDLVTVSDKFVKPYPLWTLPADSLARHPYIRNYETARAIVLYRETMPPEQWTMTHLLETGILSQDNAERLSRCIIASP